MKDVCDFKKYESFDDCIKHIISNTPIARKAIILKYLRNGKIIAVAAGSARDIFSGKLISSELTYLTDGIYGWRSDIPYYFDKYNIQLNNDFIKHVLLIYFKSDEHRKFMDDLFNHREPICPDCGKGRIICPQGKIKQPHYFQCTNNCGWHMNIDYTDSIVE